jgi:ankyrin repeat protein
VFKIVYQMRNITIVILMIFFSASLLPLGYAESDDHNVYQVQKNLRELGYDPGSTDGILGKKTISAVKSFQQDNGLPVTGQLDEQTRTNLLKNNLPSQVSFINAIQKGDIITVKALIAAGANVNAENKSGETPLHIAAVRGYQEITSLLIVEGADVNAIDKRKLTPLHAAAWSGYNETVSLLIANCSEINAIGENGITPLHVSALSGSHKTMTLLINEGADINAKNKDGMTPLHAAALTGQKEAVQLLIYKGADINAKNNEGLTALQIASQKGHQSIVELLRKGAQKLSLLH